MNREGDAVGEEEQQGAKRASARVKPDMPWALAAFQSELDARFWTHSDGHRGFREWTVLAKAILGH
jgi:hypothetical protein